MIHVNTLIIGSGFAGSAVAHQLKDDDYLIIDRGEAPSHELFQSRYQEAYDKRQENPYDEWGRYISSIGEVYRSELPFNPYQHVAKQCDSRIFTVGDGLSNAWGGISLRIRKEVMEAESDFAWPFSFETLAPFYDQAEQIMHVVGDKTVADRHHFTAHFKGSEYWHQLFAPHFDRVFLTPVARHITPSTSGDHGICCGSAICSICPTNANASPLNLFQDRKLRYGTLAQEIIFENNRATKLRCKTIEGETEIAFNRLVVAAHGVNSCGLLWGSQLPKTVSADKIGRFFNDHAVIHMGVMVKDPVKYGHLNTRAYLCLPELSGLYEGIDVHVVARTYRPPAYMVQNAMDIEKLNRHDIDGFFYDLSKMVQISCYMEIPSEIDMYVRKNWRGKLVLNDDNYWQMVPKYDRIVAQIKQKLTAAGITIHSSFPEYKTSYGDDHIGGTLNMAKGDKGIVDADFRLKGTENVYISGAAVFPRPGGQNPTLTVTALGLMLGEKLRK